MTDTKDTLSSNAQATKLTPYQEAIIQEILASDQPRDELNAPWTLQFDRDGTEDFGIICDAEGKDIVASHLPSTRIAERTHASGTFWLPEDGGEIPPLVRQMQVMMAAPKLLEACRLVVERWQRGDLAAAARACQEAIAEATPNWVGRAA
jgi:hypothetical protein